MPRATKRTLKGLHTAIKSTTLPTAAATTISAVLQNQDTSILKAFVSLYCLVDLSILHIPKQAFRCSHCFNMFVPKLFDNLLCRADPLVHQRLLGSC